MGTSAPATSGRVCLKLVVRIKGKMNYYQILGLTETADMEAIKKAYRRLAKECHPDAYPGDKKAEERFKQITEAYAVLSDAKKRKEYDRGRTQPKGCQNHQEQETKTKKPEAKRNPIDASELFERYMGFK